MTSSSLRDDLHALVITSLLVFVWTFGVLLVMGERWYVGVATGLACVSMFVVFLILEARLTP